MRLRSTLILLLVLIGLIAYVRLVEVPKAEHQDQKETLVDAKAADVTDVVLEFADRKIHAAKTGIDWRLVEPIEADGDDEAVNSLVSAVTTAEIKKTLEGDAGDLARYGLDKPVVTVTMKAGDKELPVFSVGKDTPIGGSVYLKRKDSPKVMLSASSIRFSVDKQPKDLRDKKLVTVSDDELNWIEIQGHNDIRLVRDGEGTWQMERPGPYKSDPSAVQTYLSSLRALRAVDFIEETPTDLKQYALDTPRLKVRLGGKDDSVKEILFGSTKGADVYAQVAGRSTVVTVSDPSYRNVDKFARDLRDKTILKFDKTQATALRVERKDSPAYELKKGDDGRWTMVGSDKPLKLAAVDQLVADLSELKGYEIEIDNPRDLAPLALNAPRLKVTISGQDGTIGTVLVGETDGADNTKHYNTMTEGGPTVFLLRSYVFTRIDKSSDDLIDAPTPIAATPPTAEAQK